MKKKSQHIAIIPARKGSKGLPFKNRMFFDYSADFIDSQMIWDRVIVSSNDEIIKKKVKDKGYEFHSRSEELSGDTISVKEVFCEVVKDFRLDQEDILWVISLPVVYKNPRDFRKAKAIIDEGNYRSLCGFITAKSHPFYCWSFNKKNEILTQYIDNDIYRRQDLPPAFTPHNYLQCMKVSELHKLNSEMLNSKTFPYFLDKETEANLIEIDTPEELEEWKKLTGTKII
tara:strand:- start:1174 stop:1860 length:687 start_codon:yes stop_codon:yes gene_type:complete